jgi:hypothetical protein
MQSSAKFNLYILLAPTQEYGCPCSNQSGHILLIISSPDINFMFFTRQFSSLVTLKRSIDPFYRESRPGVNAATSDWIIRVTLLPVIERRRNHGHILLIISSPDINFMFFTRQFSSLVTKD